MNVNKLDKKDFLRLMDGIWDPQNHFFRERYNLFFREGVMNIFKHGDTGEISKLITFIPCEKSKLELIHRIESNFPLSWSKKTNSFKLKKSVNDTPLNADKVEKFAVIPPINITLSENQMGEGILIEKTFVTKHEFVDFILDTIVLNRHVFSLENLEQIETTLEKIKKQIIKKKGEI